MIYFCDILSYIGGKIVNGRVVWERSVICPDGSVEIMATPFLNIYRALGDFWSFNYATNEYVSPKPHICDYTLDVSHQDFFILTTNSLWNIMSQVEVVDFVKQKMSQKSTNLTKCLVVEALDRYRKSEQLADNITIVITCLEDFSDIVLYDQVVPEAKKIRNLCGCMRLGERTSYHCESCSLIRTLIFG